MNIAHHIEQGRRIFPDKPAIIFEEKIITYKELDTMANQVANGLCKLGIRRGDRVALFLPNIPQFAFSYLGIQKMGAIAVSVNSTLKTDEVKFILNDSGSVALITSESLSENVPEQDIPDLKHILVTETENQKSEIRNSISLEDLMNSVSSEAYAIEMEQDDPAAIVYTSGTTGVPKGATLSHGNVVSNMHAKSRYTEMGPDDRILTFVPLYHSFGQNAVFNSGLTAGATIVLHRKFDPGLIIKSVSENRVTMFFGPPTTYIPLCDRATVKDMESVRYYFSAASSLPKEIEKKWVEKHGIEIHQGYGLTETSPFACYNHHKKFRHNSIGTPIENVEMKILADDGTEAEPGQTGEIVIQGPNVMLGYWNRPTETAETIQNGWLHTGDIGKTDEDGYFYIVDRLKDMVNVGGLKVYPAEVENVLYQHPAVEEVAIYGVSDPLMGEQVSANIVLRHNHEVTEKDITFFCRERCESLKVPRFINFVDSIPKSPTGKILKRVLREQAENNTNSDQPETQSLYSAASVQQSTGNSDLLARIKSDQPPVRLEPTDSQEPEPRTLQTVQNWIVEWLADELATEANTIDPAEPFANYGLDSLGAVKLADELGDWLGYRIEAVIAWNFSTAESLAEHLTGNFKAPEVPLWTHSDKPKSQTQGFSNEEIAKMLAEEITISKERDLM
ncbi:MAG: long-chain-fatty-acid--CoA ligase [Desulfobacterales bacterium]|nr:long-chain-fatty-acid--CoA ligase [Desulfobacterales bacterium]